MDEKKLAIIAAEVFFENPKWAQFKQFVKDYLDGMQAYLKKHPEKTIDPYMEFFCDLMIAVKNEQERIDFKEGDQK